MPFLLSARQVHLVDGHILKAVLTKRDGESRDAELDLNDIIGNTDGWFMWEGVSMLTSLQLATTTSVYKV